MGNYVDGKYLTQLPLQVKGMVAQIEGAIKSHIVIRKRKLGDVAITGAEHLPTLDCYMNMGKMFVTIILPDESLEAHLLTHELIHAWRNIVISIPRLQLADKKEDATFAMLIENDIEHLFIIPEEIKYFPEALHYWERLYANLIAQIAGVVSLQARLGRPSTHFRTDLLRHWLVLSILPNGGCHAHLEKTLDQAGYLDDAKALVKSTMDAYPNKERMLVAALRCLGFSIDNFERTHYDVANRTCPVQKLSDG